MPIETITVKPQELFHHKIRSPFLLREIILNIESFWDDQSNLGDNINILWDFRGVEFPMISFDIIEHMGMDIEHIAQKTKLGKSALLMDDVAEKHLASYLLGSLKNIANRDVKLFHDLQQAKIYLEY